MIAMNNYIRTFMVFAVIVSLFLVQNKLNTKKEKRGRQMLFPYISIIYSFIAVALLTVYRSVIWGNVNYLIQPILKRIDWVDSKEIFFANALTMLGFLLVKTIFKPIIIKKWEARSLMESTSSRYYQYEDTYDEWFLKNRYINVRKLLNILVGVSLFLTGLLLSITWINGSGSKEWLYFFPSAALIILNEIRAYISGITKDEYVDSILGDEADARKIGSFYRIREIYEKLFPGQLLVSYTGTEFMSHKAATDMLEKMEASKDKIDKIVAQHFLSLDELIKLEPDCVSATCQLMHGQNVIFFNPFYRDLEAYLTLPLINTVLQGKKCLVIGGSDAICQDVSDWLSGVISDYSRIKMMWKVGMITQKNPDFEVGILTFKQLYDTEVMSANRTFFSEAEFILILEPSSMLSTGQIGLSMIAKEVYRYGKRAVYCICDRFSDGLIDTMSHVLHTEFTNVVAPPVPRCVYTGMAWDVNGDFIRQKLFDKQTKYLGNGMELAAVAIKNQIPHVTWYGENKAPMKDIRWIVGQHFSTICRYMNIPTQQNSLYEKISFVPSLWSKSVEREQFIIVEDEFCNMFTMIRTFLTRGIDQTFVNILSENYLMRDYMRCNQQMFLSNPNAIPSLLPDYAKSERNTIIKLIIMMAFRQVSEEEIAEELRLAGCKFEDTFTKFSELLRKYTFVDGSVIDLGTVASKDEVKAGDRTTLYSISAGKYREYFSSTIRNAYYIVEDEKSERDYIDIKMFGHITQTVLPGQFVTYDGKYYEVKHISHESGVILRRASDLYSGRKYYRQIRTYYFSEEVNSVVLQTKKVAGIEYTFAETDFKVCTLGYLELDDNHNLRRARTIDLSEDPSVHSLERRYRNKGYLKIKLPETTDKIRFTMSILLSELFRSIFSDSWQYLAVVTSRPDDISGILNDLVYSIKGNFDPEGIYIIEDSDIDLGLLDAVRRNFPLMLEIITDFLDWHFEKMREPEQEDPSPIDIRLPEEEKRRNAFLEMADRIRVLFGKKEKNARVEFPSVQKVEHLEEGVDSKESNEYVSENTTSEVKDYELSNENVEESAHPVIVSNTEESQNEEKKTEKSIGLHPEDELEPEDSPDLVHIDGTDIFEEETYLEDNDWLEEQFIAAGISPIRKTRYQKECFLKFGFVDIDARLKIEDVQKYFHARGYSNNNLTKARKREAIEKSLLDLNAVNHCDFCRVPLSGVSFEQLNDGRVRCNDCSSSAISTLNEFKTIYYRVLEMMEVFYSIRFHVPISVKMTDARTIAAGLGEVFKPTTYVSERTLGYAQLNRGKFSILLENGSPRLATIETMSHELTHIWQYVNWKHDQLARIYDMRDPSYTRIAVDIIYEGMAVWAATQYLYQIGETYFASQQEEIQLSRNDIYGIGFRLFCNRYPLVKDMSLIKYSPFSSFPPLDPKDVAEVLRDYS